MNSPDPRKNPCLYVRWRKRLITKLMARDGCNCRLCGKILDRKISNPNSSEYITLDHIKPLSKGGEDNFQNIQLAHNKCNQLKANNYIR